MGHSPRRLAYMGLVPVIKHYYFLRKVFHNENKKHPDLPMTPCRNEHLRILVRIMTGVFGAVLFAVCSCGISFALETQSAGNDGPASSVYRVSVCVNQIAFNEEAPKRFTVPAGASAAKFTLHRTGESESLFAGEIKNGVGDFSSWKADTSQGTYVVRVVDGEKVVGESFPFEAGPRRLQLALLQPMVDCMIDARSVVGTHPSAFNGAPWRHGSYYSHELASLVMLYLAFGEEIEKQPRQIDWPAERAKVLSAEFKLIPRGGDREMLEDTRRYFQKYDAPAKDAPDVVKLIHWGLGMTLVRPEIFDLWGQSPQCNKCGLNRRREWSE